MYFKALIVDESVVSHELIGRALESVNISSVQVSSVTAAQQRISAEVWPLVIVDAQLPDNGLLKMLRQCQSSSRVGRVLVVSEYAASIVQNACLESGASGFVEKPFDRAVLATMAADLWHQGLAEACPAIAA